MWRTFWLGAALALASVAAEAADAQSRFQAHGWAGCPASASSRCARARGTSASSPGTWLQGYLTGFNALNQDTFDLLPWQPSELVAEFPFNVCAEPGRGPPGGGQRGGPRGPLPAAHHRCRRRSGPRSARGTGLPVPGHDPRPSSAWSRPGTSRAASTAPSGPVPRARSRRSRGRPACRRRACPDQRTLIALFYGAPARPGGDGAAARSQRAAPAAPPRLAPLPMGRRAQPVGPKLDLNLVPAARQ